MVVNSCCDTMPAMRPTFRWSFGVILMTWSVASSAAAPPDGVAAEHGMVATTHKRAVAIGVEILKRGGNAVDAAIATNAAMGVVEPMSCGMGGDLFAIVWEAKTQKLYGLNASGRAPYAATIDYFESRGLKQIPTFGPLSWSVPGCVDGWDQLRQRFGTMGWEQLLSPAIECAEQGAVVPETIGGFWQIAAGPVGSHPGWGGAVFKEGGAPPGGGGGGQPKGGQTDR